MFRANLANLSVPLFATQVVSGRNVYPWPRERSRLSVDRRYTYSVALARRWQSVCGLSAVAELNCTAETIQVFCHSFPDVSGFEPIVAWSFADFS